MFFSGSSRVKSLVSEQHIMACCANTPNDSFRPSTLAAKNGFTVSEIHEMDSYRQTGHLLLSFFFQMLAVDFQDLCSIPLVIARIPCNTVMAQFECCWRLFAGIEVRYGCHQFIDGSLVVHQLAVKLVWRVCQVGNVHVEIFSHFDVQSRYNYTGTRSSWEFWLSWSQNRPGESAKAT